MPKLYGTPGTRALSPTVCTSQSLAACSIGAQLLFDRLIVQADDQGRQEAEPHIVKAHCFPYVADATPRRIAAWMDELVKGGMVTLYRVGLVSIVQLNGWWTHQPRPRRAYPSRWQAPEGWVDQVFGVPDDEQQTAGDVPSPGPQSAGTLPATRGKNPALSVSVSESVSVSGAGKSRANGAGRDDATWGVALVVEELTGRPFGSGGKVLETLRADVSQFGADRVTGALREFRASDAEPMDAAVLVFGAHNDLMPLRPPKGRETPDERKRRERAEADRWMRGEA